jgi:hypothetical protein
MDITSPTKTADDVRKERQAGFGTMHEQADASRAPRRPQMTDKTSVAVTRTRVDGRTWKRALVPAGLSSSALML